MSKTFCSLPFVHLAFGAGGRAQMCCMSDGQVTEHGAPMSIGVHSLDEIWNSAYMRSVRRAMLNGERVSACHGCYNSEAVSGHSYRTLVGLQAIPGEPSTEAAARKRVGQGYRANRDPAFFKLELGNLCNLKCRMCFGANSSEIERDPVHGAWTVNAGGIDPLNAVWRGDAARIGPEPRIGVRTSGLYPQEFLDGAIRCWTDGRAMFQVPLQAGTPTRTLDVLFHSAGARGQHFQVIINGRPMAKGILHGADKPVRINLESFREARDLTIEIVSNKIVEVEGGPELGVPISGLILHRDPTTSSNTMHPQRLSSQIAAQGPWHMDDQKIFGELLRSLPELKRLNITGGETFISKRFFEILDFLIEQDAKHIHLELPTNCTHVDEKIIERLKFFPSVQLVLSLDGAGDTYEYIRYPGRWSVVEKNVRKLLSSGLRCVAAPVVQMYNVTRLPELYRYCDALGLQVVENILFEPARLAIGILPPKARKAVAADLFRYIETECHIADKASRLSVARYLDSLATPADADKIREFMVFTNDLDASRAQSFRQTHPELVELLADEGFEWIDDTLHAKPHSKRKPVDERDYAWL